MNVFTPEKTVARVPRGVLVLKTLLFWGRFLMFVQNVIIYVFIVVFYGAEFKFTYSVRQKFIICLFLGEFSVPVGLENP